MDPEPSVHCDDLSGLNFTSVFDSPVESTELTDIDIFQQQLSLVPETPYRLKHLPWDKINDVIHDLTFTFKRSSQRMAYSNLTSPMI